MLYISSFTMDVFMGSEFNFFFHFLFINFVKGSNTDFIDKSIT